MDDYITTTNATTTNATSINLDATSINWNTAFNPIAINTANVINPLQEKMEHYVEKIDKHVDELEEDIAFFNDKRKEHDDTIGYLMMENAKKDKIIADLQSKLELLDNEVASLNNQLMAIYRPYQPYTV